METTEQKIERLRKRKLAFAKEDRRHKKEMKLIKNKDWEALKLENER